jgi:hypothetical protein
MWLLQNNGEGTKEEDEVAKREPKRDLPRSE